jgi:hypothetical protein
MYYDSFIKIQINFYRRCFYYDGEPAGGLCLGCRRRARARDDFSTHKGSPDRSESVGQAWTIRTGPRHKRTAGTRADGLDSRRHRRPDSCPKFAQDVLPVIQNIRAATGSLAGIAAELNARGTLRSALGPGSRTRARSC